MKSGFAHFDGSHRENFCAAVLLLAMEVDETVKVAIADVVRTALKSRARPSSSRSGAKHGSNKVTKKSAMLVWTSGFCFGRRRARSTHSSR